MGSERFEEDERFERTGSHFHSPYSSTGGYRWQLKWRQCGSNFKITDYSVLVDQKVGRYFSGSAVLTREVKFGSECRHLMMQGLDILADAVALTLGPKGRNVILEQYNRPPKISKDGVTVSESIDLKNRFQNVGVKLLHEVAMNTNKAAGDGTTTATVLARAIAKNGLEELRSDTNSHLLKKGIYKAIQKVEEKLKEMSQPVMTSDEIAQVATISANGDKEIGKLIADAMYQVGRKGVIMINAGKTLRNKIEVTKGMYFENGYISPYFVNVKKGAKVEYRNPFILFYEDTLSSIKSLVPAIELAFSHKRPLLILAEDIEGEVLTLLVINRLKLGLDVCAVKAPGFGEVRKEILKDMAIITGGQVLGDEVGLELENISVEQFGQAGEVVVNKKETFIIRGKGKEDEVRGRLDHIELLLERAKTDFAKEGLEERKGRLDSGVAIIYVGGYTPWDVEEKKDRVVDALKATQAAVAEGIVAGGGTALLRCLPALEEIETNSEEEEIGVKLVSEALKVPCYTIAKNAGMEGSVIVNQVLEASGNVGYNALTNSYMDLVEVGIVDPTKVVRTAVKTAGRVASLLTATEAVIADTGEKKKHTEEIE